MEEVEQKLVELNNIFQAKHKQEDKIRGALLVLHLAKLEAHDTVWNDLLPEQQADIAGRIDALEE